MKLEELKPIAGAKHHKKRVGRGNGSGYGKAAGRGENGQNSRSGGGVRLGFEGGQNPLYRRLPKRGFTNAMFKKEYAVVNLRDLEERFEDGSIINEAVLKECRLVNQMLSGVKILGTGELTKKFTVNVTKISKSAREAIIKAGGSIEGA